MEGVGGLLAARPIVLTVSGLVWIALSPPGTPLPPKGPLANDRLRAGDGASEGTGVSEARGLVADPAGE